MKIAPLIFSRTGQRDYFGNFAVRPREFPIDISWAVKKVRSAMSGVSKVNRRFLVLSQNNVCIAGIALNMEYFVNNGTLTLEEKAEAKDYATTGGRLYAVFLGYVFKCSSEIPVVTDSDLWQMFKDNIIPIWNNGRASAVEVDYYFECKDEPLFADEIEESVRYSDVFLYDAAKISEVALFKEYLSRAQKENVDFCSNVEKISLVKEKFYTAVSASADLIGILKREQEKHEQEKHEQLINSGQNTQKKKDPIQTKKHQGREENPDKKPIKFPVKFILMILSAISAVTAMIWYWWTK